MNLNSKALLQALNKVSSAVSKNLTIPVLENIKLNKEDSTITATNLNLTITTKVDGITEDMLLPFNELKNILSTAPDVVIIKKEKNVTFVHSGRSKYNLGILPDLELFPSIPEVDESCYVDVDGDFFFSLTNSSKSCAPQSNDISMVYGNVVLEFGKDKYEVFACDQKTAFYQSFEYKGKEKAKIVIPTSFGKATAHFQDSKLFFDKNNIMADDGVTRVCNKLADVGYPDFHLLVKDFEPNIRVQSEEINAAIEKMCAYESDPTITIEVTGDNISFKSVDQTDRVCSTEIECQSDVNGVFGVKAQQIKRVLSQNLCPELNIFFSENVNTLYFIPNDDTNSKMLLQKVQI